MRHSRRLDPNSFDLTTSCPECGYKIPPNEMMRLDTERMRCPNCKRDVMVPTKSGKRAGTDSPKGKALSHCERVTQER